MAESQTDDRQSDLAVMEANEYKQKRRLECILDALDAVQERSDEAWQLYVSGEISRDARNITIQRTVQNAIRECYKLLLDNFREAEGRDWYWAGDQQDPLGVIELDDGSTIYIPGLREFLESPTYYDSTIERTMTRRNMPDQTHAETIEVTMPENVSYRAYLRLKEFLDDVHDMEISFEEMDDQLPTWGFEEIPDEEYEDMKGTEDIDHGNDE